jgi:predicted methyltransferase
MTIISGVINTRFTHRPEERSLQRTSMQVMAVAFAASALAFGSIAFAAGGPLHDVSAALAAAVADSSRPDSDTARDADRKPEQTLVFMCIRLGDQVADYVADSGYFTRLFSSVVGSKGQVYAVEPTAFFKFEHFVKAVAELQGYAVDHSSGNLAVIACSTARNSSRDAGLVAPPASS